MPSFVSGHLLDRPGRIDHPAGETLAKTRGIKIKPQRARASNDDRTPNCQNIEPDRRLGSSCVIKRLMRSPNRNGFIIVLFARLVNTVIQNTDFRPAGRTKANTPRRGEGFSLSFYLAMTYDRHAASRSATMDLALSVSLMEALEKTGLAWAWVTVALAVVLLMLA